MSDLYEAHRRKIARIGAELWAMDYCHRRTVDERPKPPIGIGGGIFEEFSRLHKAHLTERIYFQGLSTPRNSIHTSTIEDDFGDVIPMTPKRRKKSIEIQRISERLKLTPRDVRRKLGQLRRLGRIPSSWFNGYKWCPPVEEAVEALRKSAASQHIPHTHEADDFYAAYLIKCRKERRRLEDELRQLEAVERLCEQWFECMDNVSGLQTSMIEMEGRSKAYAFICRIVNERGLSFCSLVVSIYAAILRSSRAPVADAKASLKKRHATFYRHFSTGELREAKALAIKAAHGDISKMGELKDRACNAESSRDPGIQATFSDWKDLVPEKKLWDSF